MASIMEMLATRSSPPYDVNCGPQWYSPTGGPGVSLSREAVSPNAMVSLSRFILGLVFTVALGAGAAGQSVRVATVERETGQPVAGVIVSLVKQDGTRAGAALTEADGRAVLRGAPGTYVVRAERIGFEASSSAPLAVADQDVSVRVELTPRRVHLSAVVVRGKRQCGADAAHTLGTVAVWEEARKALLANTITKREAPSSLPVRTYTRLVDRRFRVETETSNARTSSGAFGFRSASASELSDKGYVRRVEDGTYDFFGPDAELLLSDEFVRDHCFTVVRSPRGDSSVVGLSFAPSAGRRTTDIGGVLWLTHATAELRYIEFHYTGLPEELVSDSTGGRVEFGRLPTGRWIVRGWWIRTPRMAVTGDRQIGTLSSQRRLDVIGYKEEGGFVVDRRVLSAATSGDPAATSKGGTVRGAAFDSVRRVPLRGATVRLVGTAVVATTDSLGRYELRSPVSGDYTLSLEHDRLRALGIGRVATPVRLIEGEDVASDLAIPSPASLRSQRCAAAARAPTVDEGVLLLGSITDASGRHGVPGGRARLWWRGAEVRSDGTSVAPGQSADTIDVEADSVGGFAVCNLPRDVELRMRAVPGGEIRSRIYGPQDVVAEEALAAAPTANSPTGTIRGTVSSGSPAAPVEHAGVTLAGLGRTATTNRDGTFVFDSVPGGSQVVRVRRLGFATAAADVFVRSGMLASVTISIVPLAPEIARVTVDGKSDASTNADFERRRSVGSGGVFLTRGALKERENSKLTEVLRSKAVSIRAIALSRGGHAAASQRFGGSADSRRPRECYMQIIVDGVRVFSPSQASANNPPPNLDEYAVSDLEGVEVYAGPAQTPPEFGGPDAACGTIVLSTRKR
jgi:hypothetical protein